MKSNHSLAYTKKRSVIIRCLLTLVLFLSPVTYSQAQQNASQKKEINKTQAVQKAKQTVKGRVLRVEQGKKNYRVKMLQKSGRVVSVSVDKQSGKVVETKKSGKQN